MATKTATKIKPMKKMAKGEQSKRCPRGQAYDISLGRCVDIDDESQSLFGINLKGGVNWFGEDSKMDGQYAREREAAKNKAKGEALGKSAASGLKKVLGYKKGGTTKKTYKTGGMVNANANLKATKSPGSKGVKSGVNPKAAASKTAKKPSASRSKAPKKATPGRK
jgi:hypothetical protein